MRSERRRRYFFASAAAFPGARRSSLSPRDSVRAWRARRSRFVARITASSSFLWGTYRLHSAHTSPSTACRTMSSRSVSVLRRSSSRAFAALLVARALMEAIAFACFLALVQMSGGREPLALTPTTLALVGATLVLIAALRETGKEARGSAVVVATLGAGVLLAVLLPTHPLDLVMWGGRIIAFVIVAEVYLWRVVSLARGAGRWRAARIAVPCGAVTLALAAVAPIPVDRTPLVPLALIFVAASAVALSAARSAEELSLTAGTAGKARLSSVNSVVFGVGVAAFV